jgi:uncharacterized protein YfkK (UPF0435 family)
METITEHTFDELLQKATQPEQPIVLDNGTSSNALLNNLNELYQYIKNVHQNKITPTNIVIIASELIQIVEKYNGLTGTQKKMLVINVIKKIVNEESNTDEEKVALNVIIDITLPHVIDGFVDAINGMMKFAKYSKKTNFLKRCLFCC